MQSHKLATAAAIAALAILAAPAFANASPERRSAAACADAFAKSITAAGAQTPKYRFAYREAGFDSLIAYYASRFTFEMQMRDPKTGTAIARASCTTRKDGTVIELTSVPLSSSEVRLAKF